MVPNEVFPLMQFLRSKIHHVFNHDSLAGPHSTQVPRWSLVPAPAKPATGLVSKLRAVRPEWIQAKYNIEHTGLYYIKHTHITHILYIYIYICI